MAYNTRDDKGRYKISDEVSLYKEQKMFYPRTPIVDEKYMEIEKRYCKFFGCGERLSLIETLCGDFCERHMNLKKDVYYNGLL